MTVVGLLLGGLLAVGTVNLLRARLASRRERSARSAGPAAVRMPARLRGRRWTRAGTLTVAGHAVTWSPRWRRDPPLDLTGADVLRVRPSPVEALLRFDDVEVVCATASRVVEIHLHPSHARVLRAALHPRGGDAPPRATRPGPGDVGADTVAAAMRRRAVFERWDHPDTLRLRRRRHVDPAPAAGGAGRWWRVPALRRAVPHRPHGALVLGAAVALPAVLSSTPTIWLQRGTLATVSATVDYVDPAYGDLPFLAAHAHLHFRTGGRRVEATAPILRDLRPGSRVTIRYAVRHPSSVRVDGDGGRQRDLLVSGLVGLPCAGVLVGAPLLGVVRSRRSWRTLSLPGSPACYVLAPDEDGSTLVPLFDVGASGRTDAGGPVRVVPVLQNALGVLQVSGSCTVHGDAGRRPRPVVRVGDRVLWPAGRAVTLDVEGVAALVHAGPEAFSLRNYLSDTVDTEPAESG